LRYPRLIDRTRRAGEIDARARRFPCQRATACYEGSLATHPDPASAAPIVARASARQRGCGGPLKPGAKPGRSAHPDL
jgi:hypothetical protein